MQAPALGPGQDHSIPKACPRDLPFPIKRTTTCALSGPQDPGPKVFFLWAAPFSLSLPHQNPPVLRTTTL